MKKDHKDALSSLGEQFSVDELMNAADSHEFSQEYNNRKRKLLETVSAKEHVMSMKAKRFISVAAAGLIVAAVPASAFAAKQIRSFSVNKKQTNNYEYEMSYENETQEQETVSNERVADVNQDSSLFHSPVKMNVNYLPDGYIESTNSPYKYALNGEWDSNQNVTVVLMSLDDGEVIKKNNTVNIKDVMVGDGPATIFYKNATDDTFYDKDMYVYFKDYGYAAEIFAQVNVPEDQLIKMAAGIELTPCDEANATFAMNTDNKDDRDRKGTYLNPQNAPVKQVGDSMINPMNTTICLQDQPAFYSSDLEYTVEDFEIRDSIAGLDQSGFGLDLEDVKNVTDDDGNLTGYTHQNIEKGDKVNTVDQVLSEEHKDVKMVYVTMKVKNTSNKDVDQIKLAPQIGCLESGNMVGERYGCEKVGREGTSVYCDYPTMYAQNPDRYSEIMHYGQRYSIAAGDEETIHIGYIVDADKMDNMILFYNAAGAIYNAEANVPLNQAIIRLAK